MELLQNDRPIKSQEDKIKAIKTAEEATAKKHEEKMVVLLGSWQESISATPAASATSVVGDHALCQKCNAAVSKATNAGKSRWGDMEANNAAVKVEGASIASASVEPAPASFVFVKLSSSVS